jgi:hypothetical protein
MSQILPVANPRLVQVPGKVPGPNVLFSLDQTPKGLSPLRILPEAVIFRHFTQSYLLEQQARAPIRHPILSLSSKFMA